MPSICPLVRILLSACCAILAATLARSQDLALRKNDHIISVGSGLAERMQHFGQLEAIVQTAYPGLNLRFRNLGVSGDTVTHRPRNQGFPTAQSYLELTKASVILAFFGYNESFDDDPAGYESDLQGWVTSMRGTSFDGKVPPRIALIAPIPLQSLGGGLPDAATVRATNRRIRSYAEVMAKVAKGTEGVSYVDLFGRFRDTFAASDKPLTINGLHLNQEGDRLAASWIAKDAFGVDAQPDEAATVDETLRQAVLDKNWHWFNRYRAPDGNDIWGSRGGLAFVDGQTNADVLWHELAMIDVMVANRDTRIHRIASGKPCPPAVDDSNVPAPIRVQSNVGGGSASSDKGKEGQTTYMPAEDTAAQLRLEDGLEASVFASEAMFPELANPSQLGVDPKGRLWVAAWKTYPKWEPL